MRFALLCAALALPTVACGPVSQQSAESQCFLRAQLASKPRGYVSGGMGSDGPVGAGEVTMTSDFILGNDPSQVYESCVVQKTGQLPGVPLTLRPDWTG